MSVKDKKIKKITKFIFSSCDKSKLSIYVDDAYLSAFKTNSFWSKYSSIIKPVSTR